VAHPISSAIRPESACCLGCSVGSLNGVTLTFGDAGGVLPVSLDKPPDQFFPAPIIRAAGCIRDTWNPRLRLPHPAHSFRLQWGVRTETVFYIRDIGAPDGGSVANGWVDQHHYRCTTSCSCRHRRDISNISLAGGHVALTWTAVAGKSYRVQSKINLLEPGGFPGDRECRRGDSDKDGTIPACNPRFYHVCSCRSKTGDWHAPFRRRTAWLK